MTTEKKIEEMARSICPLANEYESCKECDDEIATEDTCIHKKIACAIINNGYRKASEVAREIFEEISKASIGWGCYCITTSKAGFLTSDVNRTLAELKKKYTEGEE